MIAKQVLEERLELFLRKAREANIRVTPQRLAIYRVVAASEDHPGVEEIHKKLQRNFPTLSLDTVYRTLRLLEDLGFVNAVGPRRETLRYDANTKRHHHFTCLRCGLIRDFEDARLSALKIPAQTRVLGQPQDLRVEVLGVCNACLKKNPKKNKQH